MLAMVDYYNCDIVCFGQIINQDHANVQLDFSLSVPLNIAPKQ